MDDDEDEEGFDDCNDIGATDSAVPCAVLFHLASRLVRVIQKQIQVKIHIQIQMQIQIQIHDMTGQSSSLQLDAIATRARGVAS